MAAKGIGQEPRRPSCSGQRKLLSKLWPGREITETLALYERLETELQELQRRGKRGGEGAKQRLRGTRNAAGPKLSQHIQFEKCGIFILFFYFVVFVVVVVGLFMPIMTVKTL